ncbi:MAG: hypothetical protein SPF23_06470 [Paludibacteraceae bacterium]|nr:hypothetical protein [Paludibacteraceae bacterium]
MRTLFIYARSLHAAGPKQPLGYTREAYTPLGIYTPSGYTLRLRLYTPYTPLGI